MNFKRSQRVQELLRHEISMFIQEIPDPRLGFVTITGVQVSDDLTDAKIFYSVLGNPEERTATSHVLRESLPDLRHMLGRKLESLYRVPFLSFVYDETPERASRVMSLLSQLSREQEEREKDAADLPEPEAPKKTRKKAASSGPKRKSKKS